MAVNLNKFLEELESQTKLDGPYRKYGSTKFLYVLVEPDTIHFHEIASLDAHDCHRTMTFLRALLDKHGITATGYARPFFIGPTISGQPCLFGGMDLERLLKWYKYYGFTISQEDDKIKITRLPVHGA